MFVKTGSLRRRLVSPIYCKITKAPLNHVDSIESITSNVRFDFVGLTRGVESIIVKNWEWPGHFYNYQSLAIGL